jgi:amylosucrase
VASTPESIRRNDIIDARVRRHRPAVERGVACVYPEGGTSLVERWLSKVSAHAEARPEKLFARDLVREAAPDWFQEPTTIGYVAYADRFAGDLAGVRQQLDHLVALGVDYLHLMPLLRARPGASDGGYAVMAYDEVDPRLGHMDDLRKLAGDLHERNMNLCVDLVVNHTAAEHPWAVAARAGDARYRKFYRFFPDRTMPDRYETTLREVFPDFAPGNFTWVPDAEAWVWTTFNEFQWDLDWSNPEVLEAMLDAMLCLADAGVDILRLDAVPFLWKREGTDCENEPEVHELLRLLRALVAIAAPAVLFKAEAIVPPEHLTPYLGGGDPEHRECDLAYNNQLMVLLWSSLATKEARLMTNALRSVGPIPAHASWVTYVRCHDDIGWAITDEAAATVGWNGFTHRDFLNDFYTGGFPGSFARGLLFQRNPLTGDGRVSGATASLCGIELALDDGDDVHLELACRRLELLYAVVYSFGGVPLIYMGDEIALRNDDQYADDPDHADDNRWLHRPRMDWDAVNRASETGTLEHRIFSVFASLAQDRAGVGALHGAARVEVVDVGDPAVFAFVRRHPVRGTFAMIASFSDNPVEMSSASLSLLGRAPVRPVRNAGVDVGADSIRFEPYGYAWLAVDSG